MPEEAVQQDMFTVLRGQNAPVVTRWSYCADDPFAVTLSVRTGNDRWVDWLMARDLVAEGLTQPAGIGDVRISPQTIQGYDVVAIEISSHDGRAVLEVDRRLLQDFIARTYAVVPPGTEQTRLKLDDEIEKITRSCAE